MRVWWLLLAVALLNFGVLYTPDAGYWIILVGGGGDDWACSATFLDGGVLLAGVAEGFIGGSDILAAKLSEGGVDWALALGLNGGEFACDMLADGGEMLIVGYSESMNDRDILVAKAGASGLEWAIEVGGGAWDIGDAVAEADGGYIVVGHTYSYGAFHYDILVMNVSESGDVEWALTLGGLSVDWPEDVVVSGDSLIIVGGTCDIDGEDCNILVAKLNLNGTLEWAKAIGGPKVDWGKAILKADSGYIILAETESYGAGRSDMLLLKITESGDVEWAKAIGRGGGDEPAAIAEYLGGYLLLATSDDFTQGGSDILLTKVASNGSVEWFRALDAGIEDRACSVSWSQQGILVAGSSSSDSKSDILVALLNSTGYAGSCQQVTSEKCYVTAVRTLTVTSLNWIPSSASIEPTPLQLQALDVAGDLAFTVVCSSEYQGCRVELTAPSKCYAGDVIEASAKVLCDSQPQPGVEVAFKLQHGTQVIAEVNATTDSNGVAIAHLQIPPEAEEGAYTLTAEALDKTAQAEIQVKKLKIEDIVELLNNTLLVVGENAYPADVLALSLVAWMLGTQNLTHPAAKLDTQVTEEDLQQWNIITVGGPAANTITDLADTWLGVGYTLSGSQFTIQVKGISISYNTSLQGQEDICIIAIGRHSNKTIMVIWGFYWQGTYAGCLLASHLDKLLEHSDKTALLIRWIDQNGNHLVEIEEVVVEASA